MSRQLIGLSVELGFPLLLPVLILFSLAFREGQLSNVRLVDYLPPDGVAYIAMTYMVASFLRHLERGAADAAVFGAYAICFLILTLFLAADVLDRFKENKEQDGKRHKIDLAIILSITVILATVNYVFWKDAA